MDPSYPPHQMSYSNQQQMWANFYGSTEGTSRDSRFPDSEFVPPHMRQERGWWAGSHWHDGGHFPGHHAPWAPQAPPPRGERPGPGRPRSTAKRERGSRRGSSGLSGVQQFPSSVGDGGLLGGDTKRGPGRQNLYLIPMRPSFLEKPLRMGSKRGTHVKYVRKSSQLDGMYGYTGDHTMEKDRMYALIVGKALCSQMSSKFT